METYDFGQLGRPQVSRDNGRTRNPSSVFVNEGIPSLDGEWVVETANEHTIRLVQVADGCTLSQEFWVGQNSEVDTRLGACGGQDLAHRVCRLARHSGFFHHDDVLDSQASNHARSLLDVPQVWGVTSTEAKLLGWRVDTDKDQVSLRDVSGHVRAEGQVAAACLLDDGVETRLENGQHVAVPRIDARLVHVEYDHINVWTPLCDHSACGPTNVAGADTADLANRAEHDRRRVKVWCWHLE